MNSQQVIPGGSLRLEENDSWVIKQTLVPKEIHCTDKTVASERMSMAQVILFEFLMEA
jgi:hypothetical protein